MNLFVAFSVVSGIVLIAAPLFARRFFADKWQVDRKIFWKAGLILMIIELFYLEVIGNASSIWEHLWNSSMLLQAAAVSVASGLFFELGRFVVMDKVFKKLRSFRESVYFAMGWSGFETLLLGILLIISSFGMQFLINNNDIGALLPDANTQEIRQMEEIKQQSVLLMAGNPLTALTPILERGSRFALDLSLTMLILLALVKGETKFVWMAAAMRALITFTGVLIGSLGAVAGDLANLTLALFSLFIIGQVKILLPKQLR